MFLNQYQLTILIGLGGIYYIKDCIIKEIFNKRKKELYVGIFDFCSEYFTDNFFNYNRIFNAEIWLV